MTRVYVPRDAAALSVGAGEVAAAIAREASARSSSVELVRNGSRGLLWLEPLVEVETPAGRVAYGPVTPEDVPGLFDAGFLDGGASPLGHGLTEEIPYLVGQAVEITEGPFADFSGTVEEVLSDKGKVKVSVSLFGRPTTVELDYLQLRGH